MEFSYEVHYRTGVPLLKSDEQLFETLEHNQVRWLFLLQIFFLWNYDFRLFPNSNTQYLFIHSLGIYLYQAPSMVPFGVKRYEHLFSRNLCLSRETEGSKGSKKKKALGCRGWKTQGDPGKVVILVLNLEGWAGIQQRMAIRKGCYRQWRQC